MTLKNIVKECKSHTGRDHCKQCRFYCDHWYDKKMDTWCKVSEYLDQARKLGIKA